MVVPRSFTPPSVLPDISPTRGEIGSFSAGYWLISPRVGEMSGRTEGGACRSYPTRPLRGHPPRKGEGETPR